MLIKDAEIFAAGTWPGHGASGVVFTDSDLDDIIASFETLKLSGRIPLKVGHSGTDVRTDDSAPSLGWVESIKRVGGKLLADIKLTSEKLAEGIRSGAYRFCSIELLRNVRANNRQIPWVLDALAILGSAAPAVGTLKSLQDSMQLARMMARPPLRFEARVAFSMDRAESAESVRAQYETRFRRMTTDHAIEMAIASGQVSAAARESFRKVFKDELYTVANWQSFAATQPRPKLGPARFSRAAAGDELTGGSANDELDAEIAAEVEMERVKFHRIVQPMDVAPRVYRRRPDLMRRRFEEHDQAIS